MNKNRHIKTFQEKYKNMGNVIDESYEFFKLHRQRKFRLDDLEIFENIPYIGIFYVKPNTVFQEFWQDTEDDLIKTKIVCVDDEYVYYWQYDSHHKDIYYSKSKTKGYAIEGNILVKLE